MSNQILPKLHICQKCTLSSCCLKDCQQENTSPRAYRVFHRGETLYSMGDSFEALFILSSGSAKSYTTTSNGHQQIANFHFPNSLLGMEGFNENVHIHNITFLETSSICRVSLQNFHHAMCYSDYVREQILKHMSHSLVSEQEFILSSVQYDAEQRLTKFLLNLSEKYHHDSLPYQVFNLSMTRIDIANYLGMAIETISRLLTKMQSQGIIKVNNRQITLCNINNIKASLP